MSEERKRKKERKIERERKKERERESKKIEDIVCVVFVTAFFTGNQKKKCVLKN